jgi:lipopolysaccharide export system protein LptA
VRWQRGARIVVAVAGVSCAAAVYFFAHRSEPPAAPPKASKLADPAATSEASGGSVNRYDFNAKKEAYALQFEHSAVYPDGHSRYEHVHLTSKRGDRQFDVRADVAVERGKSVSGDTPGVVTLTGHVRLDTSDGLHLETEDASYEDALNLARIPGHFTFTRGRLSGDSVGGTYNRETDMLNLLAQPHVAMSADPSGGGTIDATAHSMEIARTAHYINLRDESRIARDREKLSSDQAVLHLAQDESGVQLIEMKGHASVVPIGTGPGTPPDMRGDTITLAFHPDGRTLQRATLDGRASLVLANETGKRTVTGRWIDVLTAPDGQTMSGLEARDHVAVRLPATRDTPLRTIDAATLVSNGDDHGLKSALFEGGIKFVETEAAQAGHPAVSRTGTSKSLVLVLKGQLDAIDEAVFRDDVIFKDDDVSATAGQARYFATKDQLWLAPADTDPKQSPSVTEGNPQDGTIRIDGPSIKLNMETHDLDATGNVSTRMLPSKTGSSGGHSPALFEAGQEIDGTAPTLHYVSATRRAKYTGAAGVAALVWQDRNVVKADEVEFEQDSGNLSASGHVKTTFLLDKAPAAGTAATRPQASQLVENSASAKTMVYGDADRHATYTGDADSPATAQGPDGTIYATRIDLYLAKEQRSLDRMTAKTSVYAQFEGQREAKGDGLTYDAATEKYVLTGVGSPASLKAREGDAKDTTNCTLFRGAALTFMRSGGLTGTAGGALVRQDPIPCATSIK